MAEIQAIAGGIDFMLEKVDYTGADATGVTVSIVVSWFSGTAVFGLLLALGISAWNTRKSVNPHLFVRSHVAAYFISLLWCDLMQAFGSILNVRWVTMKAVEYGHYCTFQAFIKHSSDVSMGIWSLLIALHTFLVVFLRWNMPKRSLYAFFAAGWGFVLLIIIIGNAGAQKAEGPFYGISGYYCWISPNYGDQRITLDYLWLFLSAGLSFVLYTLIFLNLRGNVTTKGIHLHRDSSIKKEVDSQSVAIAKQMLIYPVAFTVLIFPMAVVRFIEWSGHAVPEAASSFSDAVYVFAGLVDVTLFLLTRRVLPEHSVIPRSINLKMCLRRKTPPNGAVVVTTTTASSEGGDDLEKADTEKFDLEGNSMHAELGEGVFQRASSPDSEHESDNQVTIRVQSVVVDRIYMQPDHAQQYPASPPGLTPSRLDDVSLSSTKGVREPARDSDYYAPKDLPPAPMSARSATGIGRGRGSPLDSSGSGKGFYPPESAPLPSPSAVRSPRMDYQENVASARSARNDYYPASPARSARDDYAPGSGAVRSAREDSYRPASPARSARDDYYRTASPARSVREEYVPSPARSAREEYRAPSPARSARDNYYAQEATSPLRSARVNDVIRSPRRDMTEPSYRNSYFEDADEEPHASALHALHMANRASPTESSHYTDEGEERIPSPVHTPRTAPVSTYPTYLNTPQSASFPFNRRVPATARDATFPPMSARLPQDRGRWN